jgi:dihydroorotase
MKLTSFADPHVHLREPGSTDKEDFYTGTCAALAGGYTVVLDMPNNPTPTITPAALAEKKILAQTKIVCDVGFHYGATPDNGATYPHIAGEVYGLKAYFGQTHGGIIYENLNAMYTIFQNWAAGQADKPLLVHVEGLNVAAATGMAALFGQKLHICHLSKASELAVIRKAKEKGLPVTCEVAPHHLFLTEEVAEPKFLGPYARMSPPLQTPADIAALWEGLRDGSIDMLATDHAPHTRPEKESHKPPYGVPGLETTFSLMFGAVLANKLSLERLVEVLAHSPRRIFNLPPAEGQIEIDPDARFIFKNEGLHTKCGWTPFVGLPGYGRVKRVWLRGDLVFEEGKILAAAGSGKVL